MSRWGDRGMPLRTISGVDFYVEDPRAEDVRIEDIAHALSNLCRFAGHVRTFYSVAEHSVRVAAAVDGPPHLRLAALLHDSAEAYLVDLPQPIKRVDASYRALEERIERVIEDAFGVEFGPAPGIKWPPIKAADLELLATEARDLVTGDTSGWVPGVDPQPSPIEPLTREQAATAYIDAFDEILHTMELLS